MSRSERYMLRLTPDERGELTRLQDVYGVRGVAGVLRRLWRAELEQLERRCRAKGHAWGPSDWLWKQRCSRCGLEERR